MDTGDLLPARRYPPRTPPGYQTVIKFLVMASILDSVWVSGPWQTGSSCGLTGMASRLPLDLSPPSPAAKNASQVDVQEALLNITARDCLRGAASGPTLAPRW